VKSSATILKIKSLQQLLASIQASAADMFNVLLLWLFFEVRVELVGSYLFSSSTNKEQIFIAALRLDLVEPDEHIAFTATTKVVSRIRVTPWKLAKIRRYEPAIHTQCRLLPSFFDA
jgi:hypothetical protein